MVFPENSFRGVVLMRKVLWGNFNKKILMRSNFLINPTKLIKNDCFLKNIKYRYIIRFLTYF